MLSRIPLPVLTFAIAALTLASPFVKSHVPHAAAVAFVVAWLGTCVLTSVRLGQFIRALRQPSAAEAE